MFDRLLSGMGQQEQLLIAQALLSGEGNWGNNLSQGLLMANQHKQGQGNREMEQMKLQQMRQQQERQRAQDAALQNFIQQNPQLAQLAQLNPEEALKRAFPQPQQPKYQAVGGTLLELPGAPGGAPKEVFRAPEKPDNKYGKINPSEYTPESFRKFATSGSYADLVPYRAPQTPKQGQYDAERGMIVDPMTGTARPVTGVDGQPLGPKKGVAKKLTEAEAKATLYVGMMDGAEKRIAESGFKPTDMSNQTMLAFARGDIPKLPKTFQNLIAGGPAQKYAQGTFQWTEAMLRQLTGAAAPETEVWRQVKTYWPMPGDSPQVIAQKEAARKEVSGLVRIVAGGGAAQADNVSGGPAGPKEDPLGIR